MKIWFTKTSAYGDGVIREFANLDEAVRCLIEECSKDKNNGGYPVELIIYNNSGVNDYKCDYTIEFYDDWRE